MGLPAVQTVFLAATVLFKIVFRLNMAPASSLAMVVATVYIIFTYPKAWRIIVNTVRRDVT
jgi:hypothetical protein